MRVLLILLIFAIGFSGFSAAAHAFDSKKCHEAMSVETQDKASTHDCPEHAAAKQGQSADKDSKKDKDLCLSCDHCCVSHAGFPQFGYVPYTPDRSDTYEVADTAMVDSAVSGLKRPPKHLV